jgi:peptide/nickel transport system permease protein
MGSYILKRVLLIIPTLLLVMMIAFFLSKLVPGDDAEALSTLQGVLPDSRNAAAEYKRNYLKLGLDKPNFYFSLTPDFYPPNQNAIVDAVKRQQVKYFLNQKSDYKAVVMYMDTRDSFLLVIADEISSTDTTRRLREMAQKLRFNTNIDEIQSYFSDSVYIGFKNLRLFDELEKSASHLSASRHSWYFPSLHWHGANNQFHQRMSSFLKGDPGISVKDGRKVSEKIYYALKWTLLLLVLNVVLSVVISVPIGLYAGFRANSKFDKISNIITLFLYSIPVFWLASLLIIYFTSAQYGSWMNIFSTPGSWYVPHGQSMAESLRQYSSQLVLPIICLVANDISQLSRIVRNNVLEQKSKLYVLFAISKGLTDVKLIKNHILPNVLLPLITVIGGKVPSGLSGALLIEVIFNIPGMGRLMYDSIYSADWPVVFGILLVVGIFTIVFMLLTDIAYSLANPKIKYGYQ